MLPAGTPLTPRLITLVALLVLFAGCGGGDDGGEAGGGGGGGAPEPQGTVAGFTDYEVPSAGFAISVPEAWKAISVDDLKNNAVFDRFVADNPQFQPLLEAIRRPNSVLKFVAIDPEPTEDYAANVNVTVEDIPEGVTLEQYVDASFTQLESLGVNEGDVERDSVTLPAGEAEQISYQTKQTFADVEQAVAYLQYALVGNGKGYVLTYTTLPDYAEAAAEDFAASAESFRLL